MRLYTSFEGADGIIVLLDALGIKGIWNRKNPAEVLNTWAALQEEYTKGSESLRNEFTDTSRDSGFRPFPIQQWSVFRLKKGSWKR